MTAGHRRSGYWPLTVDPNLPKMAVMGVIGNPPHPLFKFVTPKKCISDVIPKKLTLSDDELVEDCFMLAGTGSIKKVDLRGLQELSEDMNENTSSIDPWSLRARQLPLSKDPTLEVYDNESHKIIGRNKEIEDIKLRILGCDDIRGPSVIAVIGMSGIGKTALVKLVYSDMVNYLFDIRLWVADSSKSIISIPRILRSIIKAGTGEMISTENIAVLVKKIKHLLHDKRYLLVLDDIWVKSEPFWVELKSILDVGKGGVILITTRNQEVAYSAQAVANYNLERLPYFDCWSIFKRLAFNEDKEERFPRLFEIGKAVVHKCLGIPLAAACLGRLLQSERDEGKWLRIGNMDFTNSGKDIVTSLLKLTYDEFPYHLKRCFAHLALNQGDGHSVGRHQIFFWNALGLLEVLDEKDIENHGQNCLMQLLSRSILHDSVRTSNERIVSCKMHDYWHDLAMDVLGADLAVITWNELNVSHLSRHLVWGYEEPNALSDKNFPEELIKARSAQTFRFGHPMGRISYRFLQGIISNMHNLHILDLGYSSFIALPSSVGDLKQLRVLNLSFNPLITRLPGTLKSLLHLQALYLEGCEQLQLFPSTVDGFRSLKCLTVTAHKLTSIEVMLSHMQALEELQILSCNEFAFSPGQYKIRYNKSLRRLIVHDCPQLACFPDMTQLIRLEELVISNCRLLDLDNGCLNGLKGLQYLQISGIPGMSCLPSAIQNIANSLQGLVVRDCKGLVELPNWLCSFALLRSFVIYSCPSLLTLPGGFHETNSLMELKIKSCPHLSSWFETPEGYFLSKCIPQIEIDGRLITQIKEEGDEASSSAQISEFDDKDERKLYFCLFPNDYEFKRETLVQLWMAAGYFKNGSMEELAGIYFDSCIDEGHILSVGTESFTGVYRYKINVDRVVDDRYIVWKGETTDALVTMCQHISVMSSNINHKTFETLKRCHELRTLLFFRDYGPAIKQVPSDMFLALQRLESLNLSCSDITELSGSIGSVTQLRLLDLSFTLIERLPETIDRLVELQTLKLEGCKQLYSLPSGMKKLIKLRHLYFDVLGQLSAMPKGIGALTELRTLSAFIVDVKEGCNLRDLKDMNNLRGRCCISGLESVSKNDALVCLKHKQHVTQLQLRWDGRGTTANKGNASTPVYYLEPHSCLEKLELYCYPNTSLPYWIAGLSNLSSITFFKCEITTLNATLGKLPSLKYLDIIQMNKVKTIEGLFCEDTGYFNFPELRKLTVDGMYNLISWKRVTSFNFPCLSEFTIKHCPKIKTLPVLAALNSLEYLEISYCKELEALCDAKLSLKLKTLVIDSCPLLTRRCSKNGEDWFKIQHVPDTWIEQENISSPSEDDSKDGEEGESGNEEEEESEFDNEEAKEGESGNEEAEEGKPYYEETEEGELGDEEAEEGAWRDKVAEEGESDDVELNKGASGDKDADTT